nr:hypothetical protein [Tanacetum cinerariifolium]
HMGKTSIDLLRDFLNLGPAGDSLALSKRGKQMSLRMDFRNFVISRNESELSIMKTDPRTSGFGIRPSPTIASTSEEGQNKDSSTYEDVASPNPPKPFVKFVKPKESQP